MVTWVELHTLGIFVQFYCICLDVCLGVLAWGCFAVWRWYSVKFCIFVLWICRKVVLSGNWVKAREFECL